MLVPLLGSQGRSIARARRRAKNATAGVKKLSVTCPYQSSSTRISKKMAAGKNWGNFNNVQAVG
jgi:hypothetical protein